jgi:hypothetical protein
MTAEQRDLVITRILLGLGALGFVAAASLKEVFWAGFFAATMVLVKWWYWTLHVKR